MERGLERPDPTPVLSGRDGFALQFALIGVLFAVFADWAWALQTAGPIFVWAWLLGGALQLGVALCIAALAGANSRSGYWWLRWSYPRSIAWLTGYLVLVGYLAAIADSEYRLAGFLLPFAGITHYSHPERVALALLCLALQSPWSMHSMRWVRRHINIAVGIHLIGIVGLVVALTLTGMQHGPAFLFSTTATAEHEHMPRFLIAFLVPVSVLTGFDAPGRFALLFRDPRRYVPRAIVGATFVAFLAGALLLIIPLLVLREIPPFPSTLLSVIQERLGSGAGLVSEVLIVTSLWFRAVVLQLVAVRLVTAQAEFGAVPGWRLRRPQTEHGPPRSVVFACLLAPAIVCLALPDASALTFVWPALWALAYAIIITAGIWRTMPGRPSKKRWWNLRGWSTAAKILAVGWCVSMVVLIPVLDVARAAPLVVVIIFVGVFLSVRSGKP